MKKIVQKELKEVKDIQGLSGLKQVYKENTEVLGKVIFSFKQGLEYAMEALDEADSNIDEWIRTGNEEELNLSKEAILDARKTIERLYGQRY